MMNKTIRVKDGAIIVPKTEYLRLKRRALAYQSLMGQIFEKALKDPIDEVVEDFRATNLYEGAFLKDLEDGLRKSSYGKI